MDSDCHENAADLSYTNSFSSEESKPVLVDASIQLDLTEDCSSESELHSVDLQNFTNGLDMKLPITIQNCVSLNLQAPSELLITKNDVTNLVNEQKLTLTQPQTTLTNDTIGKKICIEQNGQTYILTLPDGLAGIVEVTNKEPPVIGAAQLIAEQGNFKLPSKRGINQNWFTSKAEKDTLHKKGHVWKQGMWSKEEIELLVTNIQQYCEDHEIDTPSTVIFEMAKDERKDFYRTIAKGLNRPLFSVYRRVVRMYDNKNHVGKYTAEELEKLRQLRSLYGNNWQAIGNAMGRSASSIKDRCRLMKDNCNQGKWLPAEEKRLAEAVYELANALPGEMISSGLSWADVAERVGTRSEKQCRTKWLNYLNWKEAGGTEWTREDDVALIYRVYVLGASDENHIDWNELAKGWMSARSPQWLRGKWWSLKRHVANANTIPFQEVCEWLYQQFVLKIQTSVKDIVCSQSSGTDSNLSLVSAQQLLAQSKPSILSSLPGTTSNSIVVTSVPITQGDESPISLPTAQTVELQNGVFPPVQLTPIMQTLEVLAQPGVQLPNVTQPFLTASSQSIVTATLPKSPIIIRATIDRDIHSNEGIAVVTSPSILLNSSGPPTSFASTQIPSAPSSPHLDGDIHLDEEQVLLEQEGVTFEPGVVQDDVIEHEHDDHLCKRKSCHIILADPMLAGSRSPENLEFVKDQGCGTDA